MGWDRFDASDPKLEFISAWIEWCKKCPFNPGGIEPPPPLQANQYRVSAQLLNVRQHPWTGNVTPAVMRQVSKDTVVTVYAMITLGATTWGMISPNGNEWVSTKYLTQ